MTSWSRATSGSRASFAAPRLTRALPHFTLDLPEAGACRCAALSGGVLTVHTSWRESPSVPHAVPATWLPPRTRLQPSHEHPHSGLLYQALLHQALCLVTICLASGQVSVGCVLAAAIVFPVDRFTEFWYPALRDGVNFVQVGCQVCPPPTDCIMSICSCLTFARSQSWT